MIIVTLTQTYTTYTARAFYDAKEACDFAERAVKEFGCIKAAVCVDNAKIAEYQA